MSTTVTSSPEQDGRAGRARLHPQGQLLGEAEAKDGKDHLHLPQDEFHVFRLS